MSQRTSIEWTEVTWNPLRGCSRKSRGCENCYAERIAARFSAPGQAFHGIARRRSNGEAQWTGKVELVAEKVDEPLRWRRPRVVFVNSMSDLFHEQVPDEWLDRFFAVMALTPRHTYQVLTKRPERMRAYLNDPETYNRVLRVAHDYREQRPALSMVPISRPPGYNVWIGTSVEDDRAAQERIPHLVATHAYIRFLSCEPLLGPLDLGFAAGAIRWVIAGAESGQGARPMDLDWVRSLRDYCVATETGFFFKQDARNGRKIPLPTLDGRQWREMPSSASPAPRLEGTV